MMVTAMAAAAAVVVARSWVDGQPVVFELEYREAH